MIAPFAFVILFSPFDLIEASIDRTVLPKELRSVLDPIGVYTLKDGKNDRLVLLYIHDSDWVTAKANMKKGTVLPSIWPNGIQVHAVYQDKTGKWTHKQVFGYARVRFTKVAKEAPDHLILECRPNFMIGIEPGEDIGKALKRAEEINRPFTKRVSFVDGVLTAK